MKIMKTLNQDSRFSSQGAPEYDSEMFTFQPWDYIVASYK